MKTPSSKTKPLISVIIIFLNEERFLAEAIDSVLAQTYENWELLLVDDGSTDASTTIAKEYAKEHSLKIHYLEHAEHQNRGMSASRNLGIQSSNGQYVTFLDADDVYNTDMLDHQIAMFEAHPEIGMVYGATEYWYSWQNDPEIIQKDFILRSMLKPGRLFEPPELLELIFRKNNEVPLMCSLMIRRDILVKINGFEEKFTGMCEDQVFIAKTALETPILMTDHCCSKYRQHSDSCNFKATRNGEVNKAHLVYLDWLSGYLSEKGLEKTALWEGMKREKWFRERGALFKYYKKYLNLLSLIMHPVRFLRS